MGNLENLTCYVAEIAEAELRYEQAMLAAREAGRQLQALRYVAKLQKRGWIADKTVIENERGEKFTILHHDGITT